MNRSCKHWGGSPPITVTIRDVENGPDEYNICFWCLAPLAQILAEIEDKEDDLRIARKKLDEMFK